MITVLFGCVIAYAICQAIKNIIDIAKGRWTKKSLLAPGGMPSSHTATVAALAAGIFFKEQLSSSFAVSLVLLAIVSIDAIGVRQKVGKISASVNKHIGTHLETRVGHTALQVAAGAIVGFLSALIFI